MALKKTKTAPKNKIKKRKSYKQLRVKNIIASAIYLVLAFYFYRKKNTAIALALIFCFAGHNFAPDFVTTQINGLFVLIIAILNMIYYTTGSLLWFITGKLRFKNL